MDLEHKKAQGWSLGFFDGVRFSALCTFILCSLAFGVKPTTFRLSAIFTRRDL